MLTWVGAVGRSKLTIHACSRSHLVMAKRACLLKGPFDDAFEFDVAFRKIKSDFKKLKLILAFLEVTIVDFNEWGINNFFNVWI